MSLYRLAHLWIRGVKLVTGEPSHKRLSVLYLKSSTWEEEYTMLQLSVGVFASLITGQEGKQRERRGGDRRAERGAREMLLLSLSPTQLAASGFHGDEVLERGRWARTRAPQEYQEWDQPLLQSSGLDLRHPAPTMVSRLVESSRRLRSTRSPVMGASALKSPVRTTRGLQREMGLLAANTRACQSGDLREGFVWQVHRRVPAMPCKFTICGWHLLGLLFSKMTWIWPLLCWIAFCDLTVWENSMTCR